MSGFSPGHPSDRAGGRTPEPVQERGQTGTGVSVGSKATGRVGSWGLGCPSGQGVEAEPKHFKPWEDVVLKNKMSMGPLFHGRGKTSVSLTPPTTEFRMDQRFGSERGGGYEKSTADGHHRAERRGASWSPRSGSGPGCAHQVWPPRPGQGHWAPAPPVLTRTVE